MADNVTLAELMRDAYKAMGERDGPAGGAVPGRRIDAMIPVPSNMRVWVAAGVTDMPAGIQQTVENWRSCTYHVH